jgi:hypothetical protein
MNTHGILDKIFYDENITLEECKKLSGEGLELIKNARIELTKLKQEDLDWANDYQKEMALNRFKYARDMLMLAGDNGHTISEIFNLFCNDKHFAEYPFLTDIQCLKLSRLSNFSYSEIRTEFSTKDPNFMAN